MIVRECVVRKALMFKLDQRKVLLTWQRVLARPEMEVVHGGRSDVWR